MTKATSIFSLICLVLVFPLMASDGQSVKSLDDLRWQFRILIVMQEEAQTDTIQVLKNNADGIEERDLLWFSVQQDKLITNAKFQSSPSLVRELTSQRITTPDSILLIGKDGTPKYSSSELDINELFAIIDGMPMRKREMAQRDM